MAVRGYIKNLRNYTLVIQHLGWIMDALTTEDLEDGMPFELLENSQAEIEAKITAGDIEIQDATTHVMTVEEFRVWLFVEWDTHIDRRIEAFFYNPVPSAGSLALSKAMVSLTRWQDLYSLETTQYDDASLYWIKLKIATPMN